MDNHVANVNVDSSNLFNSDVTALLTFATPIIIIVSRWNQITKAQSRTLEASIMMLTFTIITAILFTDILDATYFRYYKFILMLPIYAWIVSRFGSVVMSITTLILTIVVLAGLVNHASPFDAIDRTTSANVLAVQGFLVPVTLTILFIAALLESRKAQFEKLLNHERQLRNLSRIKSLGTMAGGVAHDFGNLAIAMRAYHSVLRQEIKDPNQSVITAIRGLEEAADGAQTLTKSLMTLARDEQDDTPNRSEIIDLCAATKEAITAIAPLITPKYTLTTNIQPTPIYIAARQVDIQRILSNLIINAKDASQLGQPIEVTIKQHNHDQKQAVWLLISDHGAGMTPQTQEHAFDPFFTTKPRAKGTGLGLAVVAGIVRDMHATINLASTLNQGTTIAIDFPVVNPTP